ncbi:MAG TPA: hypothetical protein VII55_02085 [Candidatus Saccharimonadales bacterium]
MANTTILPKRIAISKANTQVVIIVAVAAFVTVFCLVASKAVLSQYSYQARVTTAKEKALKQLKENVTAFSSLSGSYQHFDSQPTNVIGGTKDGTGNNNGTNSQIILDALPPAYDFPALTSSLEKILTNGSFTITSITGTDDQLNQQSNTSSTTPQPVQMPFSFTVTNANYTSVQALMTTLQQSIRPIQVDTVELSGGVNNMSLTVGAHTYYQPATNLNITKKAVK